MGFLTPNASGELDVLRTYALNDPAEGARRTVLSVAFRCSASGGGVRIDAGVPVADGRATGRRGALVGRPRPVPIDVVPSTWSHPGPRTLYGGSATRVVTKGET